MHVQVDQGEVRAQPVMVLRTQDDKSAVRTAARSRFTVAFTVLICAVALASGNATAAFGSASFARSTAGSPSFSLTVASAADGQTAAGGSVVLGGSPGDPAANPENRTVYVPIQCTTNFCAPNKPEPRPGRD